MSKKLSDSALEALVLNHASAKTKLDNAKKLEIELRNLLIDNLLEEGKDKVTRKTKKISITVKSKKNINLDKDDGDLIIDSVDWSELDEESQGLLSNKTSFDSTGYKKLLKDNPNQFYDIMDYVTETDGQGTVSIKVFEE